jgi:peroxiredoxin family protein
MGLNAIVKGKAKKIKFHMPGFMGAVPGMAAMATFMMKKKIDNAGIPEIHELMDMAQAEGVKFVGCKMTVDMMGLSEDAFIDGVEIMTAEDYMKLAKSAKLNMFI